MSGVTYMLHTGATYSKEDTGSISHQDCILCIIAKHTFGKKYDVQYVQHVDHGLAKLMIMLILRMMMMMMMMMMMLL